MNIIYIDNNRIIRCIMQQPDNIEIQEKEGLLAVEIDGMLSNSALDCVYNEDGTITKPPGFVDYIAEVPKYKLDRRASYPSVQEQLDMLWHGMDEGTLQKAEPFYSVILGVKQRFPKALNTTIVDTVVI